MTACSVPFANGVNGKDIIKIANAGKNIKNITKEGINEEKLDEILPAIAGMAARLAIGGAVRGAIGGAAKGVGGAIKNTMTKGKDKYAYQPQAVANKMMTDATRIEFSEYNEFYKALDAAAKSGKKAGDSIEVGGKTIKLKSNPKQMHQLSDSDMDKIELLAQRLNEKGCGSHKSKNKY